MTRKVNIDWNKTFDIKATNTPSNTSLQNGGQKEIRLGEQIIYLSPDDIDSFVDDVRMKANEKYEDIKESVKSVGIETPIPIAKHPKTHRWMVFGGGNTRLKVAKELKLKQVPCRELLWSNKLDALMKHLKENDLRNGYTFFERCLGAQKIINRLKNGKQEMSLAKFIEYMREAGYPASSATKLYVVYSFVVKIKDIIPKALGAGLGQNAVGELNSAYNKCIKKKKQDLFLQLLAENDSVKFSTNEFLQKLNNIVSISKQSVKPSSKTINISPQDSKNEKIKATSTKKFDDEGIEELDIDVAREQMNRNASIFAKGCRLNGFIKKIPTGLGYLVTNFPRIHSINEEASRRRMSWGWWQLVQLSGIRDASRDVLNTYMPDRLVEPYVELIEGSFESAYGELDMPLPGTDLCHVYKTFDGETQTSYLNLLDLYWKISRSKNYDWVWKKE